MKVHHRFDEVLLKRVNGAIAFTRWDFDQSECRSINLFADGRLGTSYLLTETPELRAPGR